MGVGEDRLSNLYDPLLHHIFSFLPFKCVVATCILSKRWKDLWISSPVLNVQEWRRQSQFRFTETRDENTGQDDLYWSQETTGLVNFMDRLLHQSHPLFRNDLPNIKKFCLDYDSTYANGNISGWIHTLMMRKVEEISLCIPMEFVVPMGLFTCETLTVLKLEMSGDLSTKMKKIGTLRAAETISFPRLKVLHLKHMIFVDESLNAQLFSNSPVLEELMLSNCYMAITKVLHVSVASLKRLFITNSKIYGCKLNIYAPNLQSLTYNGMTEGYANTEHVFSSIVDAHIDITFESRANKNSKRRCGLKNLVGGISNVKILHISGSTLESFFGEDMDEMIPTYHDLIRLVVSSKLSGFMFFALLDLLRMMPNLESVVIAQGFSPSGKYRGLDACWGQDCLLQKMKAVEVREIDGKQEDLDVIKYFLRNSPALQIMTITFPSSLAQCMQDSVMKKILMLPKCSTFTACLDGAKGIISLRSIRLLGLQNKNTGVGKDRLSDLHDPLLHHIFSFLPFKCVVATCILSKRWKDLWISSPVLNIQEWRRYSRSRFLETRDGNTGQEDGYWFQETTELVNFMDRLLHQSHPLFRNDLPNIKKFCLDYDSTFGNDKISGWIITLVMRKVEELCLCIPIEFVVPMGLFTCETLTVLKIEMAGDLTTQIKKFGTLRAAEKVSFPRLRILHLKHMIFVDESLNAQLFSNSPVLEELMLSNCYMAITKVLHISVASLKRLFITSSKMYSCKLKIYAPNLQSLTYNGMTEGYANTEHILHISGSTLESFGEEMNEMPTFHDLIRLVVSSKLSDVMFFALLNLLEKMPNLESVVIALGFSPSGRYRCLDACWGEECLLQKLKAVEVREINGKQEDLYVIKYILRNSPALQIMTIAFPSSLPQYMQNSVMKKILMLPKSSTFTACLDGKKGIISLRSIRLLGLQNKNTCVGKDRLSDLHDPLLHHIFSFLPFKCVVATCILSKRWKDLWISSPVLNIQEWRRYSRSRFLESRDGNTGQEDVYWFQETTELVNFMDRLLHQSHPLFRNDLPNIKKFCLEYDSTLDNDKISGWIITLMMRKVEELCLCIPIDFVVPMGLFTCETLTVLKIEMAGDLSTKIKKIGTLRAAEKISFPRLKILHLKHMIFVDESLNAQLFSNSLVLEELMLSNCCMAQRKVYIFQLLH
ncbi:hypothetical protein MKW92_007090 [Papaver armeniacum]|nr:hypothetical protein MKW92_007090 [Papaver armeniacum]